MTGLILPGEGDTYRYGPSGVLTTATARCRDPQHRSYSGDKNWDECQFATHAVDDLGVVKTFPAKVAVGSAVDEAIRATCLGEEFDIENLVRRYMAEYGSPEAVDPEIKKAERLYDLWRLQVLPEWDKAGGVYAVDWELHFEIAGIPYHVHIDVALNDASLIDVKTSDQRLDRTGNGRAELDVQLTTYAFGVRAVHGTIPSRVILDGLIDGNPPADVKAWNPAAEKPWWDRQSAIRTPEQLAAFEEDVRRREASRRFARTTGLYQTQGRAHPWACNSCPAKSACPSWVGFISAKGSVRNAA